MRTRYYSPAWGRFLAAIASKQLNLRTYTCTLIPIPLRSRIPANFSPLHKTIWANIRSLER